MSKAPEIVGIGNAIVDVLSQTNDAFLQANDIAKGAMTLIETEQAQALYAKMGPAMEMSGGSAANTMAGIASLGGAAGYIGKVANDQLGEVFSHDIRALGVAFSTAPLIGAAPTARCMILITPDAQRSMCTYLGASVLLTPGDVDEKMIAHAKITYLEGYLFDKEQAKRAFVKAAKISAAAGGRTALSLSDSFCVGRHHEEFLDLVASHIDILFANETEIMALYRTGDVASAIAQAAEHCEIAVVTRGAAGSMIAYEGEIISIPAEQVAKVVDTTGAGDLYAAGFLHGYAKGMPMAQCGRIASIAAGEVIAQIGARPQRSLAELLKEKKAA